jgi:AbrB family looped-hinge helix DNA binding protein
VIGVGPKLVPVMASVSEKGLMHLPNAVRTGLGLKSGEKLVFFVDEDRRRAVLVPESEGFQFPVEP